MNARNPLHCILPPYMLKSMYSRSSGARKDAALASIVGSARLRGHREALMAAAPTGALGLTTVGGNKRRRVYSADDSNALPGRLVMQEGDAPSADDGVREAFDGAGYTYDLFWEAYQRDSLDGMGMTLDSTVHYQHKYDNAFWDGKQMVYGDGDGEIFNRFTIALDVMGHELTHGVIQYTANLNYSGQSGALNESLSDVFGSLVKQRQRGQSAADADWLVGAGLFTSKVNGVALRSMKEPGSAYDDPVLGKDPQPAHMNDYVVTLEDNGGVHINSGIPNHAFFLAAVAMGGAAWDRAGKIWYLAARDKLASNSGFQAAADLTHEVAAELYGPGSAEQEAVDYAWDSVGITIGAAPIALPGGTGCVGAPLAGVRSLAQRALGRKAATSWRIEG